MSEPTTTSMIPWTPQQISVLKQQISPKISDEEMALFGLICQRTGLDPFQHQIYAIKRADKMTIQTGIDGYRLCAARTGAYGGIDDAIFDTETQDHPKWARVTVYRIVQGIRCAFSATARWSEYAAAESPMWKKMPYLMLGKCAEALALRKAFPAELSGIYTDIEMDQADEIQKRRMPEPKPTRQQPPLPDALLYFVREYGCTETALQAYMRKYHIVAVQEFVTELSQFSDTFAKIWLASHNIPSDAISVYLNRENIDLKALGSLIAADQTVQLLALQEVAA